MDEQSDTADRARHRVAADTVITREDAVLLVERAAAPFQGQWALPGGHVERGEQTADAARREAQEETGLTVVIDDLLGIYDAAGRDPRGPVISVVYTATPAHPDQQPVPATDASDAQWFPLDDLPDKLAFDHGQILADYRQRR